MTSELTQIIIRKNKINKTFLLLFLFFICVTFLLKIIESIFLDLGWGIDQLIHKNPVHYFHFNYWTDPNILKLIQNNKDYFELRSIILQHPNFLWTFTQFTWITTVIVTFILIFRIFKYTYIPKWLKWTNSQVTLSLITIYDFVVFTVFWSFLFIAENSHSDFHSQLKILKIIITIFVHGCIPIFILIYCCIFLILDKDSKKMTRKNIIHGLIYPFVYMIYYVIIAKIWSDPYPVSDINHNFFGNIWKFFVALIIIWTFIILICLANNFVLEKLNKHYKIKKRSIKIIKK